MKARNKTIGLYKSLFQSTAEASSYIIVGTIALAIDIILFNILLEVVSSLELRVPLLIYVSKLTSFGTATVFSYWAQASFVFPNLKKAGAYSLARFFVIHATGFGLAIFPLVVGRTLLGYSSLLMDNVLTILGTSVAILAKLWLTRRFVFRND